MKQNFYLSCFLYFLIIVKIYSQQINECSKFYKNDFIEKEFELWDIKNISIIKTKYIRLIIENDKKQKEVLVLLKNILTEKMLNFIQNDDKIAKKMGELQLIIVRFHGKISIEVTKFPLCE